MSNISLSSPLEKIQKPFYQEIINKRLILSPIENSQKTGKHTESHFWTLFYQIIWKDIIIHFEFVSFGLVTRGPPFELIKQKSVKKLITELST